MGVDQYYSQELLGVSAQDGVIATAGGGQGAAFQLTAEITRVTVVATSGDSVKLPPSVPGLDVMLINHGANPMQVFGASGSGDTIDDIAGATGISQMPNSCVLYFCTKAGVWYTEGLSTGFDRNAGIQTLATADALTATGSSQGTALAINRIINNCTTVAASTGVILPVSTQGMQITVLNNGANTLSIYPAVGEKINALATNAAFSASTATVTILTCTSAGQWWTK